MSIRKFETLATNEIFYIDSDIIEDTVHSGTFKYKVSEGNPNIQYKTFRVVLESDNRNVTIWNKECFRTYEEALSARQELNEKLIERREQMRIARQPVLDEIKKGIPDIESTLRLMLSCMYASDIRDAVIERLNELCGYDLTEVNPMIHEDWD